MNVNSTVFRQFYFKVYDLYLKHEMGGILPKGSRGKRSPALWTTPKKGSQYIPAKELFKASTAQEPTYFHDLYLKMNPEKVLSKNVDTLAYYNGLAYINKHENFYPEKLNPRNYWIDVDSLEIAFIHKYLSDVPPDKLKKTISSGSGGYAQDSAEFIIAQLKQELTKTARSGKQKLYYGLKGEILDIFRELESQYFASKNGEKVLTLPKIFESAMHSDISAIHSGKIAWGSGLTLLPAPNLMEGWNVNSIKFVKDVSYYRLPDELKKDYELYMENIFKKVDDFDENEERFMLAKMPHAVAAQSSITLHIKKIRWSYIAFFHDLMKSNDEKRKYYIDYAVNIDPNQVIEIPNSFVLHLIVETADGDFLLTRIRNKKDYPKSWALTLGKQIHTADLNTSNSENILNSWVRNGLNELGFDLEYDENNLRFMALNLEANNVNFALVSIVKLNIGTEELNAILSKKLHSANERSGIRFMNTDNLVDELISPTDKHHPSTGLRMLYSLIYRLGPERLEAELVRKKSKSLGLID